MSSKKIKGVAGFLNVNDAGEGGLPVVFVHSFAGDAGHWSAQLEHLRKTRRAVAFDMRGHGESDAPTDQNAYSIESLSADIAAVVDELGIKRFVLVGHSMGGAAALVYAGKHPERVAGLVLAGAPGKVPAEQAKQIIASLESDYEKTMDSYWRQLLTDAQPSVLKRLTEGKEKMSQDSSMNFIKAVFEYDPMPSLQNFHGQKLAITTPRENQPYDLHNLKPNLSHKVISGTSHWTEMDKPEEFNQILDEFLAQVEAGDQRRKMAAIA